jgi:hypothetical protein
MGLNYIIIFYLYIYIWLANTLIRRTEQTKIEKAMLNWSLRTPDHKQEAIFPVNHNSNLSPPVTGKIKFGTCNSGVPAQASVPFKWLLRDTMHRRAVPKSIERYNASQGCTKIFQVKPSRWWSSGKSLGPRGLLSLWFQVRALWLLI